MIINRGVFYLFILFLYFLVRKVNAANQAQNFNQVNETNSISKGLMNYYPVIGILTLPSGFQKYNHASFSYIYTSYVQYFQQSGARIIPLKYTDSLRSLRNKMRSINGLVIPGGGANLMQRNIESGDKEFTKFAEVGKYLISLAKKINRSGQYFPIWGTCLGFELLVLSFTKAEVRQQFQGENHLGGFTLSPNYALKSRLFKNISSHFQEQIVNQQQIYYFNHKYGFKINKFLNHGILKNHFIPIAYSEDLNGKKFVSIAEAKRYPFYGIQFHPEKLQFEWSQQYSKQLNINEISIVQYFANFFFSECMKNTQRFRQAKRLSSSYIENYKLVYLKGYEQGIYLFNNIGRDQFKHTIDNKQQSQFIEDKEDSSFSPQIVQQKQRIDQQTKGEQNQQPQQQQQQQKQSETKKQEKIQVHQEENNSNSINKQIDEQLNQLNQQSTYLIKVLIFLVFTLFLFILIYIMYERFSSKHSKSYLKHKVDEEQGMIKIQVKNE